ncbi:MULTISPECIES: helix-turn-helix transcriptional regulator [unclassified Adlercreutzia]|uniref:helix-turn-helix transcriptional regulator n=1 Tax=unclassified Adlercreutzia TaxID=2636013 RepID=UPI0013EC5622|nr:MULTISPECIES: helix-turn-helix transcriptional regulator [unclassified Adlercreutzia]
MSKTVPSAQGESRAVRESGCSADVRPYGFSGKEQLAVDLLLKGLTSAQSAQQMGVKPSTVRAYLQRAYKKAGVANADEMVALIERDGRACGVASPDAGCAGEASFARGLSGETPRRAVLLAPAVLQSTLLISTLLLLLPGDVLWRTWNRGWELVCGATGAMGVFGAALLLLIRFRDGGVPLLRRNVKAVRSEGFARHGVMMLGFATALLMLGVGACVDRFVTHGIDGGPAGSLAFFAASFLYVLCLCAWVALFWLAGCEKPNRAGSQDANSIRLSAERRGGEALWKVFPLTGVTTLAYLLTRPYLGSVVWSASVVLVACAVVALSFCSAPYLAWRYGGEEGGAVLRACKATWKGMPSSAPSRPSSSSAFLSHAPGVSIPRLMLVGCAWGLAWEELWRSLSAFSVVGMIIPFVVGSLFMLGVLFALSWGRRGWGYSAVAVCACLASLIQGSAFSLFAAAFVGLFVLLESELGPGLLVLRELCWCCVSFSLGGLAGLVCIGVVSDVLFVVGFVQAGPLNPLWSLVSFSLGTFCLSALAAFGLLLASARNGRRMRALLEEDWERSAGRRVRDFLERRGLNDTQVEVALLVACGATTAQISEALSYSRGTINSSRAAAYRLLRINSRSQLVALLERELAL